MEIILLEDVGGLGNRGAQDEQCVECGREAPGGMDFHPVILNQTRPCDL